MEMEKWGEGGKAKPISHKGAKFNWGAVTVPEWDGRMI